MSSVADWSTTASENTVVGGVFIGEQCPPGNMNNMGRAIMAEAKVKFDTLDGQIEGIEASVDPTLAAIGDLVTSADTLPYFTGLDTAALTALTPFARTLLDDTDAETMAATIGAVRVLGATLARPGFLKLKIGTGQFIIQWGTATFNPNGLTSVTYPTPFSSFSVPIVSAAVQSANAQDNNPGAVSAGLTSFSAYSALDGSVTGYWLAVGV